MHAAAAAPFAMCIGNAFLTQRAGGLDNGVGLLPPLGYNTWNDMGCAGLSEAGVRAAADSLVATGLRDLGYRYVNLDDCWHDPSGRVPATGRLQEDPFRFPSGLAELGNYLHERGLKFGIYTDRGSLTCGGRPGSLGNEELDADTFARWGVDYVKEDNCFSSTGPNDQDAVFQQFGRFRDGLNKTGRPIYFSVCGGGGQLPLANLSYYATDPRGGGALANSWRVSSDCTVWVTCQNAYRIAADLGNAAGLGGFNDPDMLLGSSPGAARRLSPAQSRTQLSVWAILMAPLLIGAPLQSLSGYDLETYSNKEVLDVDQDLLRRQGSLLSKVGSRLVWGRELAGGDWALVFENDGWFRTHNVTCGSTCWGKMSFPTGTMLRVRDLWAHAAPTVARHWAVAGADYSVSVAPQGASVMLRFSCVVGATVVV